MEITYRHHQRSSQLELRLTRLVRTRRRRHGDSSPVDVVRNVDMEFIDFVA